MSAESLIIEGLIIFVLILINAFFSTSEIAIISSRRSIIEKLAKEGNESAAIVSRMKNEPERFLATVQVGVTVVGTLASVVGGVAAVEFLKPLFAAIPLGPVSGASEYLAIAVVVGVISYFTLVVGELVPKSLALRYAERIACFSAKPIDLLSRITSVFIRALTSSTTATLKLIGVKGAAAQVFAPREEIKYFIKEGRAKGLIEETEAALLHGIFEFADTSVKEVMVPKPKFSSIEIGSSSESVLKFISESGFSRYPVFRENENNIAGILFNKDVFRAMEQGRPVVLAELIRPPYFVPNSIMISRLLREMQKKKLHMAIVVDEHGDVDGLVTIEDILEEIVGEIEDESDIEKGGLIEKLKDGTMLIDASASLWDLAEAGLPFEEEEKGKYSTLAGFMLSRLQKIPKGGEFIVHRGMRFTVVDMEKHRIARVKAEPLARAVPLEPGVRPQPLSAAKTTKIPA
ncbi:MAG: HlyC/CorC family transporter [Deltaproteobacteria bacterium]|nr:HlyC/CorC family transporter [Deltaproteobacteria bacterium]